MTRKIVFIFFMLFCSGAVFCQPGPYSLSGVPEELKKNASIITHYNNSVFTLEAIDQASLKVKKAFTVMNEDGKEALFFFKSTSTFRKLADAELKVYDASGKLVSRYKKKDMITEAMGEDLIDDGYVTYLVIPSSTYPVTVEQDYEIKYKGTLLYPTFEIQKPGEGVILSSFSVKVLPELGIRYKPSHIEISPEISDEGKWKVYSWQAKNLAPIAYEESAVSYEHRYPSVLLAPNKFKMDDYDGDMTSWKNFGEWYGKLIKNMDLLPEDRKAFFRNMVSGVTDEREKMRMIYDYLQKNFRYVSIQLGIGSFKPLPANFTDQKKYGDCKGLSNYMHAALNAVGIKSYLALINRESNGLPVDPVFPNNSFNHVILCIPGSQDTVWLECTSNSLDFGQLDISTENKNALVVTENGGVLVPTPVSNPASNTFHVTSKVILDDDNSGQMMTTFRSKGEYKDRMEAIVKEKKDDQKEAFVFGFSFKQPDEFEFRKKSSDDVHTTELLMSLEKIPEFTAGSKIFLAPRLYKLWNSKLPKTENRRLDFYFRYPFHISDTTIYILPQGYIPDVLPQPKELTSEYAFHQSGCWFDEKERAVYSTFKLVLYQHVIPAAKYPDIKKFFDEVAKNDGQRIVIKKE